MTRVVLVFIACAFFIGTGFGFDCYFCHDDSDRGNCEAITWPVFRCRYSCVTYQAKTLEIPTNDYFDYGGETYNISMYRRGCGPRTGCKGIKKFINDQYYQVYEIDCKECDGNLCNNRGNHPGYKFKKVNYWDRE